MRLQTVFLAAVLAAPQAVAQTTPALPSSPAEWRAAAVRDIEAGYRVTLAEHAGAHDPHNPAFLANLEAARAHANALAARVADGAGYTAAVLAFSSRIQDGHAGLYPTFDMDDVKPPQWPGFMAAWRGDLFVHAAEEGSARAGERIVSCDGKDARALMEQNLFPWFGRIREEGQWWSQVRNLFFDFGNPFVQRPQRCVFELDGRRTERTLAWRAVPESARTWGRDSMYGDTLPVGLTEPRKNLFWVAMPTFQPSDQERAAYQAIYQQVRSQRARFLGADAIVVDLRRNQGGSSWWSRDFAAALWGEARLKERDAASKAKVEIWYRAAPGNIAFFRQMKEDEAAAGRPESAEWWAKREAGMLAAQAAGRPYFVAKDKDKEDGKAAAAPAPAPFTRPVYVIVPGNCASACLDAIDYFKLFPNTKLVGAPSSADSTYMEVRQEVLPGGLGRVIVPTKLWVNRPRGNGEFYRPDIPVTAVRWSTAGFLDVIERDLAR
jgi:hypothetical protein